MSRPSSYGPGPAEVSMSAELAHNDVLGQDPSVVMAGLDPNQLATNGIDFSAINVDGLDLQALGVDETFFSAFEPTMLNNVADTGILDAVPMDGVGDITRNVGDVVADGGSSFLDVLSDILSGLF